MKEMSVLENSGHFKSESRSKKTARKSEVGSEKAVFARL
jgi:hypothetical protein